MKKSKKIINIISLIIGIMLILFSFIIALAIAYCNILPTKYLILVYLVIALIILLPTIILIKKKFKSWCKITSAILSIVLMIMYSFIIFYIDSSYDFMDRIKSRNLVTETYYIVINNTKEYQDINELNNKKVGTYNENLELYDKAISEYKNLVSSELIEYNAISRMANELIDNELEAIIISAAHKDIIDEELEMFYDSTKILHSIDIKTKYENKVKHTNIDVAQKTFTIYISGLDKYGKITSRGTSDVNMLVTINPNVHQILLTSIPRDYYVQLHNTTGYKDKLTHAGFYGIDMSINTIEDFMNIKIDYYIKVNFTTLVDLVDIIGGVDVYSDKSFVPWTDRSVYIKEGWMHMDGKTALAFARERKTYIDADRHRVKNQQDVLTAIIKKVTTNPELLTKYPTILNSLSKYLETNINTTDITKMMKLQIDKMPSWEIKKYSLNGSDSSGYTYTFGKQELWVMEPIKQTIDTAYKYIDGMKDNKTFDELGIK